MPFHTLISASKATKRIGSHRAPKFFSRILLRAKTLSIAACLTPLILPGGAAAKNPEPAQRIPLGALGFQTVSPRYLLSGATMLTLDYVDSQHLLVTFGVSKLMPRLADCRPEDEDRVVDAVLLELPSGRAVARTEWRLHDIGQYLWSLGDGTFLLRRRNELTTFAPLAQVASTDAFALHPFLRFDRRIDTILVSADHDLLTVETSKPPRHLTLAEANAQADAEAEAQARAMLAAQAAAQAQANSGTNPMTGVRRVGSPTSQATTAPSPGLRRRDPAQAHHDAETKAEPNPIHISFLRLLRSQETPGLVKAEIAGSIGTSKHLVIPVTADGYLRTRESSDAGVLLDFVTFPGKVTDLGAFDTSCPPSPTFISHSEFVAFGCRGSDDKLSLAGFNVRGDLMWQLLFSDSQAYPSFDSAIPAGRFAFSRTLTTSTIFPTETPSTDQLVAQEVRVLQTYNGKQLLRVFTSPIQRAGQNFALSPDGLTLAVIHDPADAHAVSDQHHPAIEIYKLPPLTGKDEQEVKAEASLAPAHVDSPIRFTQAQVKDAVAEVPKGPAATQTDPQAALIPENTHIPAAPPATPVASSDTSAAASSAPPAAEPEHHRKPPSLYDNPPSDASDSNSKPTSPAATTPQ